MKEIFKNPFMFWLRWFFSSRKLQFEHRHKKLKIGYLSIVKNVKFGVYNTLYSNVRIYGSELGDYVYINNNTFITRTKIGKFCSIGADVKIGLGIHPTSYFTTFPAFFSTGKQCQISFVEQNMFREMGANTIGNDVWIGDNVMILGDVSIGDGAIVAAGAVVSKDVPPYAIVGGIPAKLIKYRFEVAQIEELLELQWWNKSTDWIREHMPKHPAFRSPKDIG